MTTRYLTLLRHAHAAPPNVGMADFDRQLDADGLEQLKIVQRRLRGLPAADPDFMLVSSAERTRQTAATIATALGVEAEQIMHTRDAYLASAQSLLDLLRAAPETASHIILVGHNPGISDLIGDLVEDMHVGLPTAGFAHLLATQAWNELRDATLLELG